MDAPLLPHYPNLSDLSLEEVSQAWSFLAQAAQSEENLEPPEHLQHLSGPEWGLLSYLLHKELHLKAQSLLH